ncbi:1-phosphofructokinase family hexose kinase [Streptacidiphilus carbonis]|uniref:1-phosphofructokinase family hexose kinase n=1 Tax=Streptacidiphilus carbonis TaxID=105422 RepID=UPI0005A7A756|nr:hexose kinase [Streptacidiphilus carbonis]
MIVTVTLNAALDTTYRLDALRVGGTNRVASVRQRAGGKGVNTARVLAARGRSVLVAGLAGGPAGRSLREDLCAAGLPHRLTPVRGATRRTVAVVDDDGEVTGLWEPGPEIAATEWRRFAEHDFPTALVEAEVLVLSGSLPPGVPADAYAVLLRRAEQLGVPAVLDADGEALLAGLAGRPALVKPNAEEARRATGCADPATAADRLRGLGAATAVVTAGADGLFGSAEGLRWHTPAPRRIRGNPTGAGDAATAALAIALADGLSWPDATADAAALAAAAVAAPLAGDYDPELYRELTHAQP